MIIGVTDASQIGASRRAAAAHARASGGGEQQVARIGLVATEMATNLLKHAGGGDLAVGSFDDAEGQGVELLALDRGPGMTDFRLCFEDGYSTAGSPGSGLGAIVRQADQFAVFSRPGLGSVLMARIVYRAASAERRGVQLGAVVAPYPGEQECGDGWVFGVAGSDPTLLLVDGSGHGPLAAAAAQMAMQAFDANLDQSCERVVEAIHRTLAATRGAAIGVARIAVAEPVVRFVGVGNVVGAVASGGEVRRMVSHNGTAGHIAPRIREFTYPFTSGSLVILHSDGLSAKWDLGAYPGLAASHPSVVAGVLFRDHRRGRDDAAVVVMRTAR